MRISAITNWAYGITVLPTVLSGTAFMLSARSAAQERLAVEQHLGLDDLGEELALGSEERTDEARLYVMRDEQRHFEAFQGKEDKERRRESAIKDIRSLGASVAELAAVEEVERDAEVLNQVEAAAVSTYRNGDQTGARQALFGRSTTGCKRHFWAQSPAFES